MRHPPPVTAILLAAILFASTAPAADLEIWQIQGQGMASPLANQVVTTRGAIVTAVGPVGFCMQTPPARTDGDPLTSDGIYVYLGSRPAVQPGDTVDVTGTAAEYYGLTEIKQATVTVIGTGAPLPDPVAFDSGFPSPAQPWEETALERFEGMLVRVGAGTVTGPTDRYGSFHVVARSGRAFREPGIAYPGLPDLPVWDGNPEVIEVSPGWGSGGSLVANAGSAVTVTGALGWVSPSSGTGRYQIWPTSVSLQPPALPRAVRARAGSEWAFATLNLLELTDDLDDPTVGEKVVEPGEYAVRLAKHSTLIRTVLGAPELLAVQEVESRVVLADLAARIASDDPSLAYTAHVVEARDRTTINVGFLARSAIRVDSVQPVGADATFSHGGQSWRVFDRPPLVLRGAYLGGAVPFPFVAIAVHLRSLLDIDGSNGEWVRAKRDAGARWLADFVQELQAGDPTARILVGGDFNAFEFTDGYVDVLGQITGTPDPLGALLPVRPITAPPLADRVLDVPEEDRYSYVYGGSAQALDHVLTSSTLAPFVRGAAFGRGNSDAADSFASDASTPLRASDHDGLVVYLAGDSDSDGVPDDREARPPRRALRRATP